MKVLNSISRNTLNYKRENGVDVITITCDKKFSEVYYYLLFSRLKREIVRYLNHGIAIPGIGTNKSRLEQMLTNYPECSHLWTHRICCKLLDIKELDNVSISNTSIS